jgi:hypothetical protein
MRRAGRLFALPRAALLQGDRGTGSVPRGTAMPPHGFSIGQSVELVPGKLDGNIPRGTYTVLRLLPNDASDREYRVKNIRDGHERVVRESQIRRGPASVLG